MFILLYFCGVKYLTSGESVTAMWHGYGDCGDACLGAGGTVYLSLQRGHGR